MRRAGLGLALVVGVLWTPVDAQDGPDVEGLRITHETLQRAATSGNLARLESLIHPRAIGFFQESQQLVRLRSGFGPAQVLPPVLDELAQFSAVDLDVEYRVAGATGVVALRSILRRGGEQRFTRGTYVYAHEGGNWRLLSWHGSDLPLN